MNDDNESWDEWQMFAIGGRLADDAVALYVQQSAALGVNAWEIKIFESISHDYGQVSSKELLAHRAFGIYQDRGLLKAKSAVERCFRDGLIQYLSRDFLLEMKCELDAGGYLQPTGLIGHAETAIADDVGLISFTRCGAELYHRWIGFNPATSEWYTFGGLQSPLEIYGTSEEWCDYALPNYPVEYEVDGPAVPIGRWCDRWWNRFERGYRLTYSITNQAES